MGRQNLHYVSLFLFELHVLFLSVEELQVMWLILYAIVPFFYCEAPVTNFGNSRHCLEAILTTNIRKWLYTTNSLNVSEHVLHDACYLYENNNQ